MVKCPECSRNVEEKEYDREQDMCFYCLFPESQYSRPIDVEHDRGERNLTETGYLLENLQYIPVNPRKKTFTIQDKKILKIIKGRNY